ncbi:T9SS-dependent choice-of-anchor J family protein [Flavobacterium kingsejongi]|uniref:Secretion system C-terminal sorting domain-containing protein n=1 Tax=Flavobacterium kingsejongi TaxID=1678728 RepID=A0A2S1LRM6_9FLAO|nr:T9SS type A sorting domain-containing protein [Flavobacterium kingsejongi]AWG26413.1 hypothetical protein FK004_14845 [Flavobacterium kingsejongi]
MKKTLLFAGLLMGTFFSSNAQTTLFEDSFDTYTDFAISGFGQWQTLDIDLRPTYTGGLADPAWPNAGAPQAFQIFNPTAAGVTNASTGDETRNFDPRTGLKCAVAWNAVPGGGITANEDWLISPPVTLGASANEVRFWVKALSGSYGAERYRIGVYVGTGNPTSSANFTIIAGSPTSLTATYPNWAERVQSLDAYSGQTIRIGIQCVSADVYMFMIDDFKVTTATLGREDFLASKFSVFPNPATDIISITNHDAIAINSITITDLNGRIVKNTNSAEQINVSDLSAGVYMMNIASEQGTTVKKIIKK